MDNYVEGKKIENLKDCQETPRMKFQRYHAANPHIYPAFKEAAFKFLNEDGLAQVSPNLIREYLRCFTDVRGKGKYKFANDNSPYYARLLLQEHPELQGRVRIRACRDE